MKPFVAVCQHCRKDLLETFWCDFPEPAQRCFMILLALSFPFLKRLSGEVLSSPLVHGCVMGVTKQDEVGERPAICGGHPCHGPRATWLSSPDMSDLQVVDRCTINETNDRLRASWPIASATAQRHEGRAHSLGILPGICRQLRLLSGETRCYCTLAGPRQFRCRCRRSAMWVSGGAHTVAGLVRCSAAVRVRGHGRRRCGARQKRRQGEAA